MICLRREPITYADTIRCPIRDSMSMGCCAVKLSSPVLGVIILFISLAFFYISISPLSIP